MSAKKQGIRIVFWAILTAAILASTGLAIEEPATEVVDVEGFVSVLRDANEVILSVQLVADEETYEVVLDAKGLELGEQMENKDAGVEGVVSEGDDQMLWLKVQTFKAVEEEQW